MDVITKAIKNMNYKSLIEFSCKNKNKKDPYTFHNAFKGTSPEKYSNTIAQLNKMLISCLEKYLGGNNSSKWTSLDKETWAEVGQILQCAVDIGNVCFLLDFTPSDSVLQLAVFLNGIVLEIHHTLDTVKNNIAHFCEKLAAVPSVTTSRYFLFNVLIYLLRRTLSKKGLKADVKRTYNIRKSFETIISVEEANSTEIWDLFRKCFTSTLYVNMVEGQKVLALIMTLDIDRISELHKAIKPQLNSCNLSTAVSFGKIYFEAWSHCYKSQKSEILNVIEITCIQDYILTGIHTQKKHLLQTIRKVLKQFHIHKKDFEVAKMMYMLYQPILWRFLKNPNGHVRACATQLFLDVFPLEDPEFKTVATDLELNDQLLMIKELLLDDFPIVRVTAIIGLCIQMSVNWEIFPEDMLKTYFKIFVDDLSRDSATSEVRCAVAKGIKVLLENPLTTTTLRNILPKLADLFHDISENVRIAFCQCLLRVKTISAIKYFDIVPLEHLLARIQDDCHAVKKAIATLLQNSYFPKQEDPTIWLARCLMILRPKHAAAAREFFVFVKSFIGVDNSVKFISIAVKALHTHVKKKNTGSSKKCHYVEPNNKENINNYNVVTLEEAVGFDNINVVRSMMDCLAILWLSLKMDNAKFENKKYLKMLVAKVGKLMGDLCLYYNDTPACESIFYISSFLPESMVPSLASLCFLRLKNLPPDAKSCDYMTLLECLCNQRCAAELLQILKEWIEIGLSGADIGHPKKKRRSHKKKAENVSPYYHMPKPYLANDMLNAMVSHRALQRAILDHEDILKEILYFIDHIKRKFEKEETKEMEKKEADFLRLLLFNIIRLSSFLHDERREGEILFITELVNWTEEKLLKYLRIRVEQRCIFTDLISDYCVNLCAALSDLTGIGFCNSKSPLYFNFFEQLLRTGYSDKYALITAKYLYKYAVCAQYEYVEASDSKMLNFLLESLCGIMSCYSNVNFLIKLNFNEKKEIQVVLSNVMQVVHNHIPILHKASTDAFKFVVKCVIDGLLEESRRRFNELDESPFSTINFPENSALFLSIVHLKTKLVSLYIKYFTEYFKSEKPDIPLWIASCMLLSVVLEHKNVTKQILKEANTLLHALEKSLNEIYPKKNPDDITEDQESGLRSIRIKAFQKHCYNEFLKLQTQQISKMCYSGKCRN